MATAMGLLGFARVLDLARRHAYATWLITFTFAFAFTKVHPGDV